MSENKLKTYFSASELSQMGLPGLPKTPQNINAKAKKEGWESRPRNGHGGGREYAIDSLSEAARNVIMDRHYRQILESATPIEPREIAPRKSRTEDGSEIDVMRQCPALLDNRLAALTIKQRQIADARATLAMEVFRLRSEGMSRTAAVRLIVTEARCGTLPPGLQAAAEMANARKGSRKGMGERSLQEWVSVFDVTESSTERLVMLAPGHHKETPWHQVSWLENFFIFYRNWKRPTVKAAYRDFSDWWQQTHADNPAMLSAMPSFDAVRRVLRKVPVIVRERYRTTGSAWRSLNTFVRRDWLVLPVNAVWVGDGHCIKLEAFSPETGNIFRPEVTFVIDAGQRFITGWSLSLSENVVAVSDALRHGISRHGVPLFYYSDNGPGQKNKKMDEDITGMLSRLQIEHPTGIPGNPQGRGVIERLNRTVPKEVARTFESYCARDADAETVRMQQRIATSALKAMHAGKDLTKRQVKAIGQIPTWEQLVAAIDLEVERYNNHPHSALPRGGDGEHYSPAAYRSKLLKEQGEEIAIEYLTPAELHEMFRPETTCITRRGEVRLFNNIYFSEALAAESGNKVRVNYDIHDANSVIIRRMDGSFICDAIWNGNKVDAFAKPVVQTQIEKRAKGRIARAEERANAARREIAPVLESKPEFNFGFLDRKQPEPEEDNLSFFKVDRDKWLKKNGTHHS